MITGGTGGSNTQTGPIFEERVDLITLFQNMDGYEIRNTVNNSGVHIYYNENEVARCFKKHEFYRFLAEFNIDWKNYLSKQLLPDNGLL